jgi:hypothetical protein
MPLDPLSWDWATIAKSAIGAGVGAAAVQGFISLYRERRTTKAQASYMAMRLAVALESYAYACADFIGKNNNASHRQDEEFPDWDVSLPELAPYPIDPDGWRAIDPTIAGRCLNLPNKIHASQGLIGSIIEFKPEDLGDYLKQQAAARGWEAWQLATQLRGKYGIEPADTVWNFADWLERSASDAEKKIATKAKDQGELIEE